MDKAIGQEFESFLRNNKKIIIDIEKLHKDNFYASIVKRLYQEDILLTMGYWMGRRYKKIPNNPKMNLLSERFIFKEPLEDRYYSIYDNITMYELNFMSKIQPKEDAFEKILISFNKSDEDRKCFFCKANYYYDERNEYYMCCPYCREYYCPSCVVDIRNMYFVGCGIFKCRSCRWVIDMFY